MGKVFNSERISRGGDAEEGSGIDKALMAQPSLDVKDLQKSVASRRGRWNPAAVLRRGTIMVVGPGADEL